MKASLKKWLAPVQRFVDDEQAATAVEYGLLAALIALVIIGTVTKLGGTLNTKLDKLNTDIH